MKTQRQPFHMRARHVPAQALRLMPYEQTAVVCDDGSVTTVIGARLGMLALDLV